MTPSLQLIAAMQAYWEHRAQQQTVKWNKEADLDFIFKVAQEVDKCSAVHAIAGTFWFTAPDGKTYKTDEKAFPVFEDTNPDPLHKIKELHHGPIIAI